MKVRVHKTSWIGYFNDEQPCKGAILDADKRRWIVELETMQDLFNWLPSHEIVVICADEDDDLDLYIEIYDDYRE